MPHVPVDIHIFDFQIRNGRLEMRVPVDEAFAAIDQAVFVHLDEDLDDGVVEVAFFACRRIRSPGHGEGVAGPIAGGADPLQLVDDGAAGLLLPFPDLGRKRLAPHVAAARQLRFHKVAFHNHLRGDPCVILARLPQRVMALHPVPARQDVLQGVVEGVAHVQNAGHVRRGDHDAEGFVR